MEKINIKHVFIVACICLICSFMSMCNSCTAKKNSVKILAKVTNIEQMDSTIITNQNAQINRLDSIIAKQITGEDVMQLYLNTAVNSPRTLEQISKDSVLSKMIKK